MSKNDFRLSASGWLVPLTDEVKSTLGRRWPLLPVDKIEGAFGFYIIDRDAFQTDGEPSAMREQIRALARDMKALHDSIRALPLGLKSRIAWGVAEANERLQASAEVFGGKEVDLSALEDLQMQCLTMGMICERTAKAIPDGQRQRPRERLVNELAGILSEAGLALDARPNGDLVQVVGVILAAAGDELSDVRKLVRPVVDRWKTSPKKSG